MTDSGQKKVQWFVGKAGSVDNVFGPYSEEELLERLRDGKISWMDGAWNRALELKWRRLVDIPIFRHALPELPPEHILKRIGTIAPSDVTPRAESVTSRAENVTVESDPTGSKTARIEPGAVAWYLASKEASLVPWESRKLKIFLKEANCRENYWRGAKVFRAGRRSMRFPISRNSIFREAFRSVGWKSGMPVVDR